MGIRTNDCDVLIVGGGPAGLATALALRKHGAHCLVAESKIPPIDKACGEGLMPDALEALEQIGVQLPLEHGAPFRGITFANQHHAASAYFPKGVGIGIRRTRLHSLLVEHAQSMGVQMAWGKRVHAIEQHTAMVGDKPIRFRWLVGADGQNSMIRRATGLDYGNAARVRYGFRRHYKLPLWTDCVEVHWGKRGQVYITPVGTDEVCVASISSDKQLRLEEALQEFPVLQERFRHALASTREQGALSVSRKLTRVTHGTVSLLGDASGSVDAVTGEGLATSFHQAFALANAIRNNDLDLYERAHRNIRTLPHRMSWLMLHMDRHDWLQRRTLAMFAAEPQIFARMLSVHVAHEPFNRFLWQQGPYMAWRIWMPTRA